MAFKKEVKGNTSCAGFAPTAPVVGKRDCIARAPWFVRFCKNQTYPAGSFVYDDCGYYATDVETDSDVRDPTSPWMQFTLNYLTQVFFQGYRWDEYCSDMGYDKGECVTFCGKFRVSLKDANVVDPDLSDDLPEADRWWSPAMSVCELIASKSTEVVVEVVEEYLAGGGGAGAKGDKGDKGDSGAPHPDIPNFCGGVFNPATESLMGMTALNDNKIGYSVQWINSGNSCNPTDAPACFEGVYLSTYNSQGDEWIKPIGQLNFIRRTIHPKPTAFYSLLSGIVTLDNAALAIIPLDTDTVIAHNEMVFDNPHCSPMSVSGMFRTTAQFATQANNSLEFGYVPSANNEANLTGVGRYSLESYGHPTDGIIRSVYGSNLNVGFKLQIPANSTKILAIDTIVRIRAYSGLPNTQLITGGSYINGHTFNHP